MANSYPTQRGLADKYLNCQLVDVSAASIAYVPIVSQGVIVDAWCAIAAAITGSDTVVTVKVIKSGTASTIGTITCVVTGSAIGSSFQMVVTGTESARSVKAGDVLVFDSDGVSSTTSLATFTGVIREL